MGMISAEVICDNVGPQRHRLTTFKLRYPKFIHGEFMTHRVISRNASSSRAIPTAKLLEEVRSDTLRAAPVFWGKNQPGMQAAEELERRTYSHDEYGESGETVSIHQRYLQENMQHDPLCYVAPYTAASKLWRSAALKAAEHAEELLRIGAHKQIVNRILEPFSHINVIATATEWENFFGLRLHKDAQPEMRALALAMWQAREVSNSKLLEPGKWHLPFIDGQTDVEIAEHIYDPTEMDAVNDKSFLDCRIKVSVARCARVSYESFETGKRSTIEEDLKLYERLLGAQPLHASPAEHQATPDEHYWHNGSLHYSKKTEWGNFKGWRQYRKMLPGEAVAPLPEGFP